MPRRRAKRVCPAIYYRVRHLISFPPPPAAHQHIRALVQQRRDMERGLQIGQDRVSLDFLVNGMSSNVPTFLTGETGNGSDASPSGSQNFHPYYSSSGQYHGNNQRHPSQQDPDASHFQTFPQPATAPTSSYHPRPLVSSKRPDTHHACQTERPMWANPPLHYERTCTVDDILLKFLKDRRDLLAQGQPRSEVIGPPYPSVASLLNKEVPTQSHPLSDIFTAIIHTFPNLNRLPEQLAIVYLMFLNMRWQVEPTKENYDRLLPFTRPVPLQLTTPHPAWMDHVAFPLMRDMIIRDPDKYHLDEFFVPWTNTLSVNWPYDDPYVLIQTPGSSNGLDKPELTINPVFDQHVRNLDNWTVGPQFKNRFPELQGTYNLKEDGASR